MDERIVSSVGFHKVPDDTFRRRLELSFSRDTQHEVAQKVVNLLFIEGDASHNEQQLMDEARAFVSGAWNFQASNRAVTFWRLGQLIQRRAYHPGTLSPTALSLWNFLADYRYPSRHDDDIEDTSEVIGGSIGAVGDLAPNSTSSGSSHSSSGGGGFWSNVVDFFTDLGN